MWPDFLHLLSAFRALGILVVSGAAVALVPPAGPVNTPEHINLLITPGIYGVRIWCCPCLSLSDQIAAGGSVQIIVEADLAGLKGEIHL